MSIGFKLYVILFLLMVCLVRPSTSRPMPMPMPMTQTLRSARVSSLASRLKADGTEESTRCWESMFQLQSCTGEVIMFFLNGETYLGPGCCQAIRIIGHKCWPDLLASLGYTTQEGDILEGYCDAAADHVIPPAPAANNLLSVSP